MPDSIQMSAEQIKFEVASLTRIFNDLGILDHSGHVTARLPDGNFVIQGVDSVRALLTPDDLFTMTLDDEILDGPSTTRPASEYHIHSEAYRARPDVNAVLHAHPQVPMLFTIAEGAELKMVINHGYRWRNGVPTHPDTAHINTPDLGKSMMDTMGNCNAVLLKAHGIVLVSESVPALLVDGIQFDRNARTQLEATRLGPPISLTDAELDIFEERFNRPHHADKLWKYYTSRGVDQGLLPDNWIGG